MRTTPLEGWISGLTGGDLCRWQLECLNRTLALARRSAWHRGRLPVRVDRLEALSGLPLMSARDIVEQGAGLVCVAQRDVARIVSLVTSGTTGNPKRVYFTQSDQNLTLDFFYNGLKTVVRPGEQTLVLLPCKRAGGVGDLICEALRRFPARPVPYGPVTDLQEAAALLSGEGIETIIGMPVQVLALARYCGANKLPCAVRAVLLTADYVPRVVAGEIERLWGCEAYRHYGTTEMGLGGAVDCDAHTGCHIRENDLLVEIVDAGGVPVPDGAYGEVVFTTLTRAGMPLIRFRTGDRSRMLAGACRCGSDLRRLESVSGRIDADVLLPNGKAVSMPVWDEAVFQVDGISDYRLLVDERRGRVILEAETQSGFAPVRGADIEDAVHHLGIPCEIRLTQRHNRLAMHVGRKRRVEALQAESP